MKLFLGLEDEDISGFKRVEVEVEEEDKVVEEVKRGPMKEYPVVEVTEVFKVGSKELAQIFDIMKVDQRK